MGGSLGPNNTIYTSNLDLNSASKAPIASLGNSNFVPPNYQGGSNNATNTSSIALFKVPSSATNSLYVDGKITLQNFKKHPFFWPFFI